MSQQSAPKTNRSLKRKSASRLAAVMALYRQHFREEALKKGALQEETTLLHADQAMNDELGLDDAPENALMMSLLEKATDAHDEIDALITDSLNEKWQKDRLGPLLESILHVAIAELMLKPADKNKIIMNEYVSLANEYYDDPELGFVNGILATIADKLHSHE